MVRRYCIVAFFLVIAARGAVAQLPPAPGPGPVASFVVFMQGAAIGNEQVTVTASADGWTVRGTGRLGNPINLSTTRFELRYDREWRPVMLEIDASLRGQPLLVRTTISGGTATNDITQDGRQNRKVDTVSADALVLPNMFFCAYEALALRLRGVVPPAELRAYVAPQAEVAMRVTGSGNERIRTADRTIAATRYDLTIANPSGPVPVEVWVDEQNRLLRFRVPAQGLEVAREDVAAVSSRVERLGRAGDEEVRVPANGFNLAATLSRPPSAAAAPAPGKTPVQKLPAVVLVPGSGPVDRDETVAGVSIFAQVANGLADAGFIVVRYDKRGAGQSGGREESATLKDYAADVRAVVESLRKRKDVDEKRIAVVGHSEGGLVGMLTAADAKKRVAALVLVATPGTTGAELVLEQQRHLLDRMALADGEKRDRMELQQRIQKAVVSGQGWESIPPGFRRQADTPWFRSLLTFDPARVLAKVAQPVMVIQGDRDRQVVVRHAQLLADVARTRKAAAATDVLIVEGINHLLVPAATGETDEYPALQDKQVSAKVLDGLTAWLRNVLHVDAARAGR